MDLVNRMENQNSCPWKYNGPLPTLTRIGWFKQEWQHTHVLSTRALYPHTNNHCRVAWLDFFQIAECLAWLVSYLELRCNSGLQPQAHRQQISFWQQQKGVEQLQAQNSTLKEMECQSEETIWQIDGCRSVVPSSSYMTKEQRTWKSSSATPCCKKWTEIKLQTRNSIEYQVLNEPNFLQWSRRLGWNEKKQTIIFELV